MSEEWRMWLYLLGFIPQLLFGARFFVQWLLSEWRGRSYVPRVFWQLSLVGHLLMTLHTCIQLQYHVCLMQACSGVIAWRNLDLMGRRRFSAWVAIALLIVAVFVVTLVFLLEAPAGPAMWFRAPKLPWSGAQSVLSWRWHLWGTVGLLLFSSRFWVQWWQAEWQQESRLGPAFWWITCAANVMLFIYFWQLGDPINWLGPLVMIVPAARNLLLLRRARLQESPAQS